MKRSFLIGSMILALAFSLCACGGDKAAGIPSRETRRLTGTYSWQDVECILFDNCSFALHFCSHRNVGKGLPQNSSEISPVLALCISDT